MFGLACYIYHFRYFLLKWEITFEVATFGKSLFSGGGGGSVLSVFAITREILSLLSGGRYFRNFTVFLSMFSFIALSKMRFELSGVKG